MDKHGGDLVKNALLSAVPGVGPTLGFGRNVWESRFGNKDNDKAVEANTAAMKENTEEVRSSRFLMGNAISNHQEVSGRSMANDRASLDYMDFEFGGGIS